MSSPSEQVHRDIGPGFASVKRPWKRALDLAIAVAVLVALSPVLLIVALAIRVSSGSPILFRQTRVGRNGTPFTLYKFRTMVVDGDDTAQREQNTRELQEDDAGSGTTDGVFKLENDPRVTGLGYWLRRFSIDEFPQLLNVLKGEMSIVGPRPSLAWEVELYEPEYLRRMEVPPGLTGLWQVSGRNRLSMRRMLELDVEYVDRCSLGLELGILLRTAGAVLRGDGAR